MDIKALRSFANTLYDVGIHKNVRDFLFHAVPGLMSSQLYIRDEPCTGASCTWKGLWFQPGRLHKLLTKLP